jgi:hypothetical protein
MSYFPWADCERKRPEPSHGAMRWLPSSPKSGIRAFPVAAALAAVAALPGAASAADKGINTDMTWGAGNVTQTAAAMQDIGARWNRITLSWQQVETRQGTYSSSALSQVDNAISASHARGVKALINVVETPSWETGSSDKRTPPRSMSDYARFVGDMATRYNGQADAWEIWNEVNTQRMWSTGVNPGQYAQMLAAAYPPIKANDPGVPVVFGGLARNDYGFVEAAYQAKPNLGSFYDVMATHPYPGADLNAPPDLTIRDGNGRISQDSFNGYREVRQTMLAHGDDKPIWFTEFGWSTWSGGVSLQTQAAYTTKAMQCVEQDPYVQIAFLYNLRNNYWANNADDWDDQLGLMNTDWTHKPAYDAYKAYTPGSGGGCTYHEANGTITGQPGAPTSSPTSGSTGSPPSSSPTRRATRTRIGIRRNRTASRGARSRVKGASAAVRFTVVGKVIGADAGRVTVQVERRVRGRWRLVRTTSARLAANGSFSRNLSTHANGKLRVRALFVGSAQQDPSRSRYVRLNAH